MEPIFAIGDIHGHVDEMERVLGLIEADADAGAPVVFLGDYVDRGPDSRSVIDRLIAGQEAGAPWVALAGNHDLYFLGFIEPDRMDATGCEAWLGPNLGGAATLASYGVEARRGRPLDVVRAEAREAVPESHRAFLAALPRLHETQAQIFVHAGIRPGVPLAEQDPEDLVLIRDAFLDDPRDHGRLVVHGHTAAEGPVHRGNRLNLDGGAGFGHPLCAAVIHDRDAHLLSRRGRIPL